MDSEFGLGQVTSVPNEQNLPMLFDEVESSQVIQALPLLSGFPLQLAVCG